MTNMINQTERTKLHEWIDQLPQRQLTLVYHLVEEFMDEHVDETDYLLSSTAMKERLLAARASDKGIPIEEVRHELGI